MMGIQENPKYIVSPAHVQSQSIHLIMMGMGEVLTGIVHELREFAIVVDVEVDEPVDSEDT